MKTPQDLPELPFGFCYEDWAGKVVVVHAETGAAATIDFTRRTFSPGFSTPSHGSSRFAGKGWKAQIVGAAIKQIEESL